MKNATIRSGLAAVIAMTAASFATAASADQVIDALLSELRTDVANATAPIVPSAEVDVTMASSYGVPGSFDSSRPLDMTGQDGSLRACYDGGGMAQQAEDYQYYCNFDLPEPGAKGAYDDYVLDANEESDYYGVREQDIMQGDVSQAYIEELADCVIRGGTLAVLTNGNIACAM